MTTKQKVKKTEVLVIGGGPAGANAAAILANQGTEVTLVELAKFPRYHIGESLLASAVEFLKISKAYDKVRNHGFTVKPGAYFQWGNDKTPWWVKFGTLDGLAKPTFQVEREEFDKILLDHAKSCGAKIIQPAKVTKVELPKNPEDPFIIHIEKNEKTIIYEAKYLIDASGRNGVLSTKNLKNRVFHKDFKNVAIWGYWTKNKPLPEHLKGSITTAAYENGWFWGIPLKNEKYSVGLVTHKDFFEEHGKKNKKDFYLREIQKSEVISEQLKPAELISNIHFEQDFSYWAKTFCGDRYFMAGDAACFIDPVLSSGIHLALISSLLAAACITSLKEKTVPSDEICSFYNGMYRRSYYRFASFVSQFYQKNDSQNKYFQNAKNILNHIDGVDLKQSFVNLISGLGDIADLNKSVHNLVGQEIDKQININQNVRANQNRLDVVGDSLEGKQSAQFFDHIDGLGALKEEFQNLQISLEGDLKVIQVDAERKVKAA